MYTVRCLPTASPSPFSPHTSTLFSSNSSWDFGRHRACQFLIVTSQTEQIHLRAWLSNTNFGFAAYLLQIVNAAQFLFLSISLSNMYTHTHISRSSLSLSISCTHTHAYKIGSHTHLPFLLSPPSVSDFLTHHLTERLSQNTDPSLHEVLSPPSSFQTRSQTVNQTGWGLSGAPLIKTS